MTDAGYDVDHQSYLVGRQEISNLIAELLEHRRKNEIIVVGPHCDTVESALGVAG